MYIPIIVDDLKPDKSVYHERTALTYPLQNEPDNEKALIKRFDSVLYETRAITFIGIYMKCLRILTN